MTLTSLITEIENETWKITEDTNLTTVIRIKEELAACERNEARADLFNDVRQLADVLIDKYLALDQEERQKMAEVYEGEECFEKIGGLKYGLQDKLSKIIGRKNLLFLQQISNYSKLIQVLENYVNYIENTADIRVRNSTLTYYLFNHNLKGEKVKRLSKDSLKNFYEYDFINNKRMNKKTIEALFKSLTHGVPDKLKRSVKDAMCLLPVKKKILENYVHYVENTPNIKVRTSTLTYYLCNYNLDGEKVKWNSECSLVSFYKYDVVNNRHMNKKSSNGVFESLTHGVPKALKQRVRDAMSLSPIRRRILKNYVRYVENTPNIGVGISTLTYYLHNYNLSGEKVRLNSKYSLASFYTYDFVNNRVMRKKSFEGVFKSLTHGIKDQELVRKVKLYNPMRMAA